jgi:hypothetical protein
MIRRPISAGKFFGMRPDPHIVFAGVSTYCLTFYYSCMTTRRTSKVLCYTRITNFCRKILWNASGSAYGIRYTEFLERTGNFEIPTPRLET